jgi:hypothetical protein
MSLRRALHRSYGACGGTQDFINRTTAWREERFASVVILRSTEGRSAGDMTLEQYKAHVAVNQIGTFLGIDTVAAR